MLIAFKIRALFIWTEPYLPDLMYVPGPGRRKPLSTGHTTYSRNNIGQKCEGNCGWWVLNEIIKNIYPENLKKIVWELPAK